MIDRRRGRGKDTEINARKVQLRRGEGQEQDLEKNFSLKPER